VKVWPRTVGDARAAAQARARAEGEADVVVMGSGRARAGLTGDYLTVTLPDPLPRRTGRFRARLEGDGAPLRAHPIDRAIS